MKPFWFAFNPADWLSAKAVRMMSLAERGAYIGLLATAWGEDRPGTLPVDEDELRRLAEMSPGEWVVSSRVLLAVFPLADCGTYRYNPRLLEEAGKREELSEKKAEAGRKSAAKRAAASTDGQQTGNTIPTGVEINPTGVAENANQLQSQLQLQSTNVDGKASLPAEDLKVKLSNDLTARLAALTDTSGEILWNDSILNKPDYFAKTARKLITALDVDLEHYRRAMLIAAEAGNLSRDIKGWESWVSIFLTNQLQRGPLLTMVAATIDLTKPTPKHTLPPVGSDCTGRHIVLPNTGDANMNRMFAANYTRDYPGATIHQVR